jgi:hypothetical protein
MWPSQRGLAEKPSFSINGEFRAETTRCSKCDHLLHDGLVRLDFMTDDVNEAEEMRIQTLASSDLGVLVLWATAGVLSHTVTNGQYGFFLCHSLRQPWPLFWQGFQYYG